MNRRLRMLLSEFGGQEQVASGRDWLAFLGGVSSLLDELEEEQVRLERSLRFHQLEIQALYQDLLCGRRHMQSLAERIDEPVILLEASGQAFLFNSRASALLGFTDLDPESEDLLKHLGIEELLPGRSLAEWFANFQPLHLEGPLRRQGGQRIPARLELHPVIRAKEVVAAMVILHPMPAWNHTTTEDLQAVKADPRTIPRGTSSH